jgi:alkylhydroperoxidase family enzyme
MDAWIQLPDPSIRMPEGHPYDFGVVLGMSRLIRAHPRIGRAFGALFSESCFRRRMPVRRERKMVAAVAAAATVRARSTRVSACRGRRSGAGGAIKAKCWRGTPGLTERQHACGGGETGATPTRMAEEDWRPLRDLGFDDQGLLEVAHIVGVFNHLTRLADGFGLALDEPTRRAETGVPLRRIEWGVGVGGGQSIEPSARARNTRGGG